MQESLVLFDYLLSLTWFQTSNVILLLTKRDLFERKLRSYNHPIRKYWPDYKGVDGDTDAGRQYFIDSFLALNKSAERKIHVFCGDVTDTEKFRPLLQEIIDVATVKPT